MPDSAERERVEDRLWQEGRPMVHAVFPVEDFVMGSISVRAFLRRTGASWVVTCGYECALTARRALEVAWWTDLGVLVAIGTRVIPASRAARAMRPAECYTSEELEARTFPAMPIGDARWRPWGSLPLQVCTEEEPGSGSGVR